MAPPGDLAADVPQTDREWLGRVEGKLDRVIEKIDGKEGRGGLIDDVKKNQAEIDELKKWRMYQAAMMIGLLILIGGRYIFGPTSLPLVP